jgi:hypothetical protein
MTLTRCRCLFFGNLENSKFLTAQQFSFLKRRCHHQVQLLPRVAKVGGEHVLKRR